MVSGGLTRDKYFSFQKMCIWKKHPEGCLNHLEKTRKMCRMIYELRMVISFERTIDRTIPIVLVSWFYCFTVFFNIECRGQENRFFWRFSANRIFSFLPLILIWKLSSVKKSRIFMINASIVFLASIWRPFFSKIAKYYPKVREDAKCLKPKTPRATSTFHTLQQATKSFSARS